MVIGLVLAAGASTRMGRPKALLPIGGDLFVTRVCRTLFDAGVDDVVVVAGPEREAVSAAIATAGLAVRVVENPRRDEGQLTSVIAGLAVVDHPGVEAVVVHLVDAPLVAAETVRAVLEVFLRTGAPIVRPAIGARHGHPVLFARELFDALRHADPSQGARSVVRAHADRIRNVAVTDEGACRDIDTPDDYVRFIGPWPEPA
jgi:molybdenum cofactor cytidylyltransferase